MKAGWSASPRNWCLCSELTGKKEPGTQRSDSEGNQLEADPPEGTHSALLRDGGMARAAGSWRAQGTGVWQGPAARLGLGDQEGIWILF